MTVGKQTAQLGNETANRIGDILNPPCDVGIPCQYLVQAHFVYPSRCVPSVCWMIDTFLAGCNKPPAVDFHDLTSRVPHPALPVEFLFANRKQTSTEVFSPGLERSSVQQGEVASRYSPNRRRCSVSRMVARPQSHQGTTRSRKLATSAVPLAEPPRIVFSFKSFVAFSH